MDSKVDDKGLIRVFVYGTLKRKHPNNTLFERNGGQFMGCDSITGRYDFLDLGAFPAIADNPDTKDDPRTIYGEVYAGGNDMLRALDWLEGNGTFYTRRKITTDHMEKKVWAYFITPADRAYELANDILNTDVWRPATVELNFWKTRGVTLVAAQ